MEKRYVVPDGMLKAIHAAMITVIPGGTQPDYERAMGEAAIRWLAENPIVPTMCRDSRHGRAQDLQSDTTLWPERSTGH